MYSIHTSIKSEDVRLIRSFDFQHPDVKDVRCKQIYTAICLDFEHCNDVTKLFYFTHGIFFLLTVRARQSFSLNYNSVNIAKTSIGM